MEDTVEGAAAGSAPLRNARFATGVACALAGAALWGFSGSCSQLLLESGKLDPLSITMARMVIAAILFAAFLMTRRQGELRCMLGERADRRRLVVFGLALFLCQVTYVVAISYTNAGTATVLQTLNVAFTLVLTCVLLRRLPRLCEVAALVCALAGVWLIATKGDFGVLNVSSAGLAWGLACALSGTFYIMYPKRLFKRWDSMTVTGAGMVAGSAFVVVFWLAAVGLGVAEVPDLAGLAAHEAAALCAVGVLGTFAAFGLYLKGVALVGPVAGSLLGTAEPAAAMVLAVAWLGTSFTGADWLGFALMVVMVAIVALRPSQPNDTEIEL